MLVGFSGVKSGQGVTSTDVNLNNAITNRTRQRSSSAHTSGPASTHRGSGGGAPPPPPPSPEVVDAVNNLPPEVRPAFRKGDVLQPDVQRMDAGTGESYNPSDPMQKLQNQVRQAQNFMLRKYANQPVIPTVAPAVVPLTSPLVSTGGGGGGGGSDTSSQEPAPGFWASLPTMGKVAIVGGGLTVVGLGIYLLTRKRGGSAASSSKSS